ncbi:NAD(P)-dependent oxidoreductase [Thalassolituus sp. LLYu03]|uniref:NAD(P)-dependent oxidoreductase n=1 Tax=Thalassolituus sp. LLYu03 TaxID=3421656 RepID=UPI003D29C533
MANLLFIGLGNMGYPMAGHLSKAGHQVTVFNRTETTAGSWLTDFNGQSVRHFRDGISPDTQAIFICVGRDDDVRSMLCGDDGALQYAPAGCLIIDHTTTSASLAEEMAQICHTRHLRFADAPVSGGQQGAINGQLSIMVGADEADYAQVAELTAPYTKAIQHMGPVGAGQKTKMVNQICVAGLIQALAEGMYFAEKAGLNVQQVMEVISQGAAGSWQMQNRHQSMIDGHYKHGFAVNWMHKDLGICLSEAASLGIRLPVTQQVDAFYQELQTMGAGDFDTSSLLYRLQKQDS